MFQMAFLSCTYDLKMEFLLYSFKTFKFLSTWKKSRKYEFQTIAEAALNAFFFFNSKHKQTNILSKWKKTNKKKLYVGWGYCKCSYTLCVHYKPTYFMLVTKMHISSFSFAFSFIHFICFCVDGVSSFPHMLYAFMHLIHTH